MSQPVFTPVTEPEQIATLANLAETIWREYFPELLEEGELEYLLEAMLSVEVLTKQIADEDYEYFFIDVDGEHIGFIGLIAHDDHLFLSKLYILKAERGHGYGTQAFEFIKDCAQRYDLDSIRLTCARNNKRSLDIYEHMGFRNIGEIDTDMGDGYQMNDFLLEWKFD